MNNIISMHKQNPDEYFIRLCNSPAQKKRREDKRAASRSAIRRRVIWMHTFLFLSGLFCGTAISAAVWSAIL